VKVHKDALFHTKYTQNFLGWGTAPHQTPPLLDRPYIHSAHMAPQLHSFGTASTLSATWSLRLGGLSLLIVKILTTSLIVILGISHTCFTGGVTGSGAKGAVAPSPSLGVACKWVHNNFEIF